MLVFCIDVDECEEDLHVCSDICINILGSYVCACPLRCVLDASGITCAGDMTSTSKEVPCHVTQPCLRDLQIMMSVLWIMVAVVTHVPTLMEAICAAVIRALSWWRTTWHVKVDINSYIVLVGHSRVYKQSVHCIYLVIIHSSQLPTAGSSSEWLNWLWHTDSWWYM